MLFRTGSVMLGLALLAGCKPDPYRPDAAPPWWRPAPNDATNWDIQIAPTNFNITAPRAMYTLDLWAAVPAATTLDYGDGGSLVTVPVGLHKDAIADLHTRTPPSIVVCQVATGTIRLTDPDAKKFPGGTNPSPPNRPSPPEPGSVIGWSRTTTDDMERFIDIRDGTQRSRVAALIGKRIELAKTIGCDAIVAQHNELPIYQADGGIGHGFDRVEYTEYVSWVRELSTRAHELQLSLGLRNGTSLSVDDVSRTTDFLMEDGCGEGQFCDMARPYISKRKAVFDIEYNTDSMGMTRDQATLDALCNELGNAGVADGIVKSKALDNTFLMVCPDPVVVDEP
jgi:hypothetical protein